MIKQLGVKCDLCNDILHTNRKCACGSLGLIVSSRYFNIYSEQEKFSLVDIYLDDYNRLVRYYNSRVIDLAPTLYLSEDKLKNVI